MSGDVHWTMREGATELHIRTREYEGEPSKCSCGEGKTHIEGEWPIHGWSFSAGQCCDCLNISVFSNGSQPDDFQSDDPALRGLLEENLDQIHICDLDAFIEMLQAIKAAKEAS